MFAARSLALGVDTESVLADRETAFGGDGGLTAFDFFVVEFLDPAAGQANEMVVVLTFVVFVNRAVAFEMQALQDSRLFELGEDAIDRGQSDIHSFERQLLVDGIGGQVANRTVGKEVEDLEARCGGLETDALEVGGLGHFFGSDVGWLARQSGVGPLESYAGQCPDGRIGYHSALFNHPLPGPRMSHHSHFSGSLRRIAGIALSCAALAVAGCSIKPYRIDIQQGNVVTAEQFAQLKSGMTRDQVKFLLGTPLLTDIFHEYRWDYRYRMTRGETGELTARGFAVHFSAAGQVERVEADAAFRALQPEEGNGNKVYDLAAPKS